MIFWDDPIPQLRDVLVPIATEAQVISPALGMPLRLIPNEQLLLDRIPDPEAELWGWERFAHHQWLRGDGRV